MLFNSITNLNFLRRMRMGLDTKHCYSYEGQRLLGLTGNTKTTFNYTYELLIISNNV